MSIDLRERVRIERQRRQGLSIRAAAGLGGVANTTWANWENGRDDLGPAMRIAVARAFEWPDDWPENPPIGPLSDVEALNAKMDRMIQMLVRHFGDERSEER